MVQLHGGGVLKGIAETWGGRVEVFCWDELSIHQRKGVVSTARIQPCHKRTCNNREDVSGQQTDQARVRHMQASGVQALECMHTGCGTHNSTEAATKRYVCQAFSFPYYKTEEPAPAVCVSPSNKLCP